MNRAGNVAQCEDPRFSHQYYAPVGEHTHTLQPKQAGSLGQVAQFGQAGCSIDRVNSTRKKTVKLTAPWTEQPQQRYRFIFMECPWNVVTHFIGRLRSPALGSVCCVDVFASLGSVLGQISLHHGLHWAHPFCPPIPLSFLEDDGSFLVFLTA